MLQTGRDIGGKTPKDCEKWLDIVTIAIPRPHIGKTIPSLLAHPKAGNRKLRRVVHLDPIEKMASDYDKCVSIIDQPKDRFDAYDIVISPVNQGHPKSVFNCFRRVERNCIYTEDDKLFVADVNVDEIEQIGADIWNHPLVTRSTMQVIRLSDPLRYGCYFLHGKKRNPSKQAK